MGVSNRQKLNNYIKKENYLKLKRLSETPPKHSMGEHLDAALELYYALRSEQSEMIKFQISKEIKCILDEYFDKIVNE